MRILRREPRTGTAPEIMACGTMNSPEGV